MGNQKRSRDDLIRVTAELEKQIQLFELSLVFEKAQIVFRTAYEAWYDERITLDETLEAMMRAMNLCKRIGVWRDGDKSC